MSQHTAFRYTCAALAAIIVIAATTALASAKLNKDKELPGLPDNGGSLSAETAAPSDRLAKLGAMKRQPELRPSSGGTKGFAYAGCTPEVSLFPQADSGAVSGYTPVEQPARQPLEGIRQVSAGQLFDEAGYGMEYGNSFALAKDGGVYRWGVFEWGTGNRPDAFPKKLSGLPKIVQIDGRFAMSENGDVYDLNAEAGPKPIPELRGAAALSQAGYSSAYVIGRDGTTRQYVLFGPDGAPSVREATEFGKLQSIEAGPYITLALDKDGKLWRGGGLYSSALNEPPAAVVLPNGERPQRIEATMSYEKPAYILSDRKRWYSIDNEGKVERVPLPDGFVQVTSMHELAVGLKNDGTVWEWGVRRSFLYLKDQETIPPDQPQQIAGFADIKSLAAGADHVLALTGDGRVMSVGSNMYGQLGRMAVYAAEPKPLGTWQGIGDLFRVGIRLFGVQDGDLWELSGDGTTRPVVLGQHAVKAISAFGHLAVLTADGKLLVADADETKPCKVLQAPQRIIDAVEGDYGDLLLALEDGSVIRMEGNALQLDKASKLKFKPEPAGKVTQVFAFPIPFALTDRGELYYQQRMQDGVPVMELVDAKLRVKQWSPLHYVFNEEIGFIGKLLDYEHRVHQLELKLDRDRQTVESASVKLSSTGRTAARLAGGAEIDGKGRVREENNHGAIDTGLPPGAALRTSSSQYYFPIEGRAYFQHLFVMEGGTIYWVGDATYAGPKRTADFVVLSGE